MAEVRRLLAREHADDLARGEAVPDGALDSSDAIAPYVTWLMDRDRKSPGLKLLQGQIWEAGYRAGELRGQVYPDVPPAIRRWRAAGLRVAIYSSGSELAQRRLFESTEHGDLTPLLSDSSTPASARKWRPTATAASPPRSTCRRPPSCSCRTSQGS